LRTLVRMLCAVASKLPIKPDTVLDTWITFLDAGEMSVVCQKLSTNCWAEFAKKQDRLLGCAHDRLTPAVAESFHFPASALIRTIQFLKSNPKVKVKVGAVACVEALISASRPIRPQTRRTLRSRLLTTKFMRSDNTCLRAITSEATATTAVRAECAPISPPVHRVLRSWHECLSLIPQVR